MSFAPVRSRPHVSPVRVLIAVPLLTLMLAASSSAQRYLMPGAVDLLHRIAARISELIATSEIRRESLKELEDADYDGNPVLHLSRLPIVAASFDLSESGPPPFSGPRDPLDVLAEQNVDAMKDALAGFGLLPPSAVSSDRRPEARSSSRPGLTRRTSPETRPGSVASPRRPADIGRGPSIRARWTGREPSEKRMGGACAFGCRFAPGRRARSTTTGT